MAGSCQKPSIISLLSVVVDLHDPTCGRVGKATGPWSKWVSVAPGCGGTFPGHAHHRKVLLHLGLPSDTLS